jgi:hypothetical protein
MHPNICLVIVSPNRSEIMFNVHAREKVLWKVPTQRPQEQLLRNGRRGKTQLVAGYLA